MTSVSLCLSNATGLPAKVLLLDEKSNRGNLFSPIYPPSFFDLSKKTSKVQLLPSSILIVFSRSFRKIGATSLSSKVLVKTDTKVIFCIFSARRSARARAIITFRSPSRIEDRGGPTIFRVCGIDTARVPS